jgi:nucleoside-diphosphate-sugar epimerase
MMMLKYLSNEQLVIMPTTNSAYGTGDENHFCTEETILKPISKYALDKVSIEKELMQRENSISLRLATVFGMSPRMRLDLLVNDFVYRACKDRFIVLFEGHFKRNYIHIKDISRVFQHGINNFTNLKGSIYNVGLSNTNISKLDLCNEIQKLLPDFVYIEAPVGKDPDQRNYIVSNSKIEKTGFTTSISLKEGLTELIKGYKMINNNKFGNI